MDLRIACSTYLLMMALFWHPGLKAQNSVPLGNDVWNTPEEIEKFKPVKDVRWNRGMVALATGARLSGYLSYDARRQVLLCYNLRTLETLTTIKFHSFVIYDQHFHQKRKFVVLPSKHAHEVFEVISEGHFQLLRQETNGNRAYYQQDSLEKPRFSYSYFIWDGNKIWRYQDFQYQLKAWAKKGLYKVIIPTISGNLSVSDYREVVTSLHKLSEQQQQVPARLAMKK